jgi:copper chaperone CopZ
MSRNQNTRQSPVQVRVLYFEGCPNHPPTIERVRSVADRLGVDLNLQEIEVTAEDDPYRLGFRGSPTVQINGLDIDPSQRDQDNCGFGCRTYDGAGVPDDELIEAALTNPPTPNADQGRSRRDGEAGDEPVEKADCCNTSGRDAAGTHNSTEFRSSAGSSIAAFGSAIVASACCWLPLLLVGLGLSLSLGGLIDGLHAVRPYLLILAAMCLSAGFYMVYYKAASRRVAPQVALWTALVATLAMAMFPYYSGPLFGGSYINGANPTGVNGIVVAGGSNSGLTTLTYQVEGMTCGGCEAAVCNALSQIVDVKQCRASYEDGHARAVVSGDKVETGSLVEAIESVGFSANRVEE